MNVLKWLGGAALVLAASGCVSSMRAPPVQLACHYRFSDIRRVEDQLRVDAAIHSVAVGRVIKSGTPAYPEYRFAVERLAALDRIQPLLLYRESTGWFGPPPQQTLIARQPVYEAFYESTDIAAAMEVLVSFTIKPGSRLLVRDEAGREVDITPRVDPQGKVTLRTRIAKGQKYIYARTVKDSVSRCIKIDIHTQQVTDATAREYEQRWPF